MQFNSRLQYTVPELYRKKKQLCNKSASLLITHLPKKIGYISYFRSNLKFFQIISQLKDIQSIHHVKESYQISVKYE